MHAEEKYGHIHSPPPATSDVAAPTPPPPATSDMAASTPRPPATSESSWAWLRVELIGSIVERLPISDYFRLRAVCTTWASALAVGCYLPSRSHFPWLMLSHAPYSFLSLPDNRS